MKDSAILAFPDKSMYHAFFSCRSREIGIHILYLFNKREDWFLGYPLETNLLFFACAPSHSITFYDKASVIHKVVTLKCTPLSASADNYEATPYSPIRHEVK